MASDPVCQVAPYIIYHSMSRSRFFRRKRYANNVRHKISLHVIDRDAVGKNIPKVHANCGDLHRLCDGNVLASTASHITSRRCISLSLSLWVAYIRVAVVDGGAQLKGRVSVSTSKTISARGPDRWQRVSDRSCHQHCMSKIAAFSSTA